MTNPSVPTVGIICELNPFHNGHAHLLSCARALVGQDGCVICVMSGRATQRGELAITDPYIRAKTAIQGGADLVVELPFPWSSGSAETFAQTGVYLLGQMGVKHLIFGSECGDISLLSTVAHFTQEPGFRELFKTLCNQGKGTTSAYISTIHNWAETHHITLPSGFPSANDLLGIAYIAAMQGTDMQAHTTPRLGQAYNDTLLTDIAYPSASALRCLIEEAFEDTLTLSAILDGCMPNACLETLLQATDSGNMPIHNHKLLPLYHAYFRLTRPQDTPTAELSGGLSQHLHKVALDAATPNAFWQSAQTKQYTNARLRRGMLFALTGVMQEDLLSRPSYATVLAANPSGCRFLSVCKKTSRIPLVTKPADSPEGRQRELSEQIDKLFTLCLPHPLDAGAFMRKSPYIQK